MYRGTVSRGEAGLAPAKSRSPMLGPVGPSVIHWEGPTLWAGINVYDLASHARCPGLWRGIQQYHLTHGYADVAYNAGACPHGYILEGRGAGIANGASGTTYANTHRYAYCAMLGVGDPITEDLLDALRWLLATATVWLGAPDGATGHRDVVSTQCPGDDLLGFAHSWHLGGTPIPAPAPQPAPSPGLPIPGPGGAPPWPGRYIALSKPPMRGSDVGTWQDRMAKRGWRIDVDCTYGPESAGVCRKFQADKNLRVDGVVGPMTWAATWNAPITP